MTPQYRGAPGIVLFATCNCDRCRTESDYKQRVTTIQRRDYQALKRSIVNKQKGVMEATANAALKLDADTADWNVALAGVEHVRQKPAF